MNSVRIVANGQIDFG